MRQTLPQQHAIDITKTTQMNMIHCLLTDPIEGVIDQVNTRNIEGDLQVLNHCLPFQHLMKTDGVLKK